MNPDKVHIDLLCKGDKGFRRELIDPHLRQLHQKNIAGMDIHAQICAFQVFHEPVHDRLHHRAFLIARENPVHIQIKHGNSSRDRIDPQRIKRRIDVHNSFQISRLRLQPSEQLITHELAFQLISVSPRHDRDPLFIPRGMCRHDPVFPDRQLLVHRQFH